MNMISKDSSKKLNMKRKARLSNKFQLTINANLNEKIFMIFFFFSSRRRHTRCGRDWSSDCALPISYRSPRPLGHCLPGFGWQAKTHLGDLYALAQCFCGCRLTHAGYGPTPVINRLFELTVVKGDRKSVV